MMWKTLAAALLVRQGISQYMAMMRFSCSQLVVERLDPLVNPGSVPSPHLHQIVGGNSFNASMDPKTHDLPSGSTCTSCTFLEDFSNYWTAVLFFRARNGTYKRVPQFVSEGLDANGGITVYYIPSPDTKTNVTAFTPGFRMLVGDASLRSPGAARKVCHRCMPTSGDNSNINCGAPDSQALPSDFCPGGIRSVITFPTCWDGKNTDSPDHESHIAYPISGGSDYDVGIYGLRMARSHSCGARTITRFSGGYSQHGDYVFGWQGDALQRAMNGRCNGTVCDGLKTQSSEEAMKCTKPAVVEEDIDSWLTDIPGMSTVP
ncbi:hypothetical protein TruAng_008787 [Truncatella angustata]|nr:hypothetical protein TruAng_008787 [Truncatella angustata]